MDCELILVNHIPDRTGESGLECIRTLKSDDRFRKTPVMLVSNYPEAQVETTALRAEPGFGKAELQSDSAIECLANSLSERSHTET